MVYFYATRIRFYSDEPPKSIRIHICCHFYHPEFCLNAQCCRIQAKGKSKWSAICLKQLSVHFVDLHVLNIETDIYIISAVFHLWLWIFTINCCSSEKILVCSRLQLNFMRNTWIPMLNGYLSWIDWFVSLTSFDWLEIVQMIEHFKNAAFDILPLPYISTAAHRFAFNSQLSIQFSIHSI